MLQKMIDGQYRRPSGLLGRWIGRKMAQQHVPENEWTVGLLNAQPTDHILEVGFGPGLAVEQLARTVTHGHIAGVDFSRTMVGAARKRNARAVREGRVDLRFGDAASLPFAAVEFDKAFSIHSIYFWPDPNRALAEIYRVLKPGGLLALTILPTEKWGGDDPTKPLGTPECKPYSGLDLQLMLRDAGFSTSRIEADSGLGASPSNYSVVAVK
jgi:ubiquinone/menaquinone biosynthesis C-methylase UbiE